MSKHLDCGHPIIMGFQTPVFIDDPWLMGKESMPLLLLVDFPKKFMVNWLHYILSITFPSFSASFMENESIIAAQRRNAPVTFSFCRLATRLSPWQDGYVHIPSVMTEIWRGGKRCNGLALLRKSHRKPWIFPCRSWGCKFSSKQSHWKMQM